MSVIQPPNAIYFPEGAGYLLVKVLQTQLDCYEIESDVMLVKSIEDNKLYIRKVVELSAESLSGIPNEIQFNPSFSLIPRVKDITKYVHKETGEYYWATVTEFCRGGDLREVILFYFGESGLKIPEVLIWKFIADMVKVLICLTENKIEHKDIWPQNIFLRYPEEDPDETLPDFLLGDFGWAVSLEDSNRTNDYALFVARVWELCYGNEWEGGERDICEDSHLSRELRQCLNDLIAMDEDLVTIEYLVESLLPYAEDKVCQLRHQVSMHRFVTSSAVASKPHNGRAWPEKLEKLLEGDWSLVHLHKLQDGSDKLSIQWLPTNTPYRSRHVPPFIRCSPGPVDLDLVYRFNAPVVDEALMELDPERQYAGMDEMEASELWLEEKRTQAQEHTAKKKFVPCKRRRFRKTEQNEVECGHPLLDEAAARMFQATDEDLGDVDVGHPLLRERHSTKEASASSKAVTLHEAAAPMSQVNMDAGRPGMGNGVSQMSLVGAAWIFVATSFLTLLISMLLQLI